MFKVLSYLKDVSSPEVENHEVVEGQSLILAHSTTVIATSCKVEMPFQDEYLHLSVPPEVLHPDLLR